MKRSFSHEMISSIKTFGSVCISVRLVRPNSRDAEAGQLWNRKAVARVLRKGHDTGGLGKLM